MMREMKSISAKPSYLKNYHMMHVNKSKVKGKHVLYMVYEICRFSQDLLHRKDNCYGSVT